VVISRHPTSIGLQTVSDLEPDILQFLQRSALVDSGEQPDCERLPGGVSSDIWVVRTRAARTFCVKRALPRLRVAAEWIADPARNTTEVRWLERVALVNPHAAPKVLASDSALGLFAMEYLPPSDYELWKSQLARGDVSTDTAAAVGRQLAAIHSSFARSPAGPADFDTGPAFHSLRLEPYLLAAARVHQDLATVLESLAERTASTKLTVVHGDVSPKNILIGPRGPVFLDAECAWFGDPAFDLAFCLNHLLLKTVWIPSAKAALLDAFDGLASAYLTNVDWETARAVDARAGALLPGLLLARIDGKSPVEYLRDEASKDFVRHKARTQLRELPQSVGDVRAAWTDPTSSVRAASRAGVISIAQVIGRRVWDSRGRPTVEAEVVLSNGVRGRAIAPAGASTGTNEAIDLRDGGAALAGFGVDRAVRNVSTEIADALRGMAAMDQRPIDRRLAELDGTRQKARLGGNALVAVSMAALHAAAAAAGEPLWRHVAAGNTPVMPMPMIQIFGGGAHAGRRIDVQDFLVVPIAATTFDHAMMMTAEIYGAAGRIMAGRGTLHGVADEGGWWPDFSSSREALDTLVLAIERAGFKPGADVAIAIDVAASQWRNGSRYVLAAERREVSSGELIELLLEWCRQYPIISVEDPVAEDDDEGMRAFTARAREKLQVIGDDYLVTSASRVKAAAQSGACNAVLLKPNQAGTVSETADALAAARAAGWTAIVSARSGETEDVTIVHLAVGWGVGQLKVGSFARGERTVKWNEAIRIEEALGRTARFGEPRLAEKLLP
jgi:enolase